MPNTYNTSALSVSRRIGRGTAFAAIALLVAITQPAYAAGPISGSGDASQLGQTHHFVMMVVYATIALFFSFLCSVAEAVILSVSPSYIANLQNTGHRSAKLLNKVKTDIDRSLAAILTLNTIAHTVGAGGAGAEAAAYYGDKYVGIAMAVLTLLILFLSEIIPKTLGAIYWRALAPVTARFIQILVWGMYPLLLVSELLTKLIARGKSVHQFSREEFEAMADIGAKDGLLDAKESRILRNLFRFPGLVAEDIMTPRTVVFALQQDMTVAEALEAHPEIGFSRIPIFAANRDEISGFVLKTDILLSKHQNNGTTLLRELRRELLNVNKKTPLTAVLEELLDHRAHILLVVDDYGGMDGVVTLEDVVETIIGIEIIDEGDQIDDMRRLARQKWAERMKRLGIDTQRSEDDRPSTNGDAE
jgi:CBS domain containing-hemolysin-like protein